jgi:K+-sensing histidine kinase KdpD
MSQTILCTIDFSPQSKHTLRCAAQLADDLRAHLTILYAYRLIKVKNEEIFETKKKIEEEATAKFSALESELLKNFTITYDFKKEVGFVTDRIEAHTKEKPLGFIVLNKSMRENYIESFDEFVDTLSVPAIIVP